MIKIVVGLLLMVLSLFGTSYDSIFEKAGADFGIEPSLLKRIATIESSMNPRAINQNQNGTIDIGLMQINTIHLRRLSKIGITQESLKDPEVNIYVAALLLSSHIRKKGYNLDAIGCYHSANLIYKSQWLKRLAMAQIPSGKDTLSIDEKPSVGDDPRSRFAQQQLSRRVDEKIAQGMNPKAALRAAQTEVDHLMGYSS